MDSSIHFHTVADKLGITIDISVLFFRVDFSSVPLPVVKEAVVDYCRFIYDFFHDKFVTLWDLGNRKKLFSPTKEDLCETIVCAPSVPDLLLEAFVRNETMYTRKHIQAFNRKVFYDSTIPKVKDYSAEYESFFLENIIPMLEDEEALKRAVIDLFGKQGKRPLAPCKMNDANGWIYSAPEDINSPLYHGTIGFQISTGCLHKDLNKAAEAFARELKTLCSVLNYAGGSVGTGPYLTLYPSQYLRYFREADERDLDYDYSDGCSSEYWNKIAFCCDCEWGNILSPFAKRKLFPEGTQLLPGSGMLIEELPNKGVYVQLNKGLDSVDVSDLLQMKRFLYPALYPGKSTWELLRGDGKPNLRRCPRAWWEKIPVFPEEITVKNCVVMIGYKKGLFP